LTVTAWEEIVLHAVESFPEECCGIILFNGRTDVVRRCTNRQNELHALDPETYPRNATTAYAMDPKELERILEQAEAVGMAIKAFYHSHPNHAAYFSEEDKAFASPFGEPIYPDSVQIVISVFDRVVRNLRAYAWAEERRDFMEVPLRKI
jgi:proteasome lid subunit RPN8/RPN11